MIKILISIGFFSLIVFTMVSCGGIDGAKAGEEYCDCMKKENLQEKMKCGEEWAEKYKDAKASKEETQIMNKIMRGCMAEEIEKIMPNDGGE